MSSRFMSYEYHTYKCTMRMNACNVFIHIKVDYYHKKASEEYPNAYGPATEGKKLYKVCGSSTSRTNYQCWKILAKEIKNALSQIQVIIAVER